MSRSKTASKPTLDDRVAALEKALRELTVLITAKLGSDRPATGGKGHPKQGRRSKATLTDAQWLAQRRKTMAENRAKRWAKTSTSTKAPAQAPKKKGR